MQLLGENKMKIEVPNLPGINLPEFEISHKTSSPIAMVHGLSAPKSRKGLYIAGIILLLLLLGGRKTPTV